MVGGSFSHLWALAREWFLSLISWSMLLLPLALTLLAPAQWSQSEFTFMSAVCAGGCCRVFNLFLFLFFKVRAYSSILASLHWLHVSFRGHLKVLFFVFRALHGFASSHLSDLFIPYILQIHPVPLTVCFCLSLRLDWSLEVTPVLNCPTT